MHANERAGPARARRNDPRATLLGVAAVALAGATAYFFVTLTTVFSDRPGEFAGAVVESGLPEAVAEEVQGAAPGSAAEPPVAESDRPPASVAAPLPGLSESVSDPALLAVIEDSLGDDAGHVGIAVRRIPDGRSASFNGEFQFYAASTFKLAILYEAELRHFRGELSYDDRIFMSDEDAAQDLGTSGYLEFEEDGSITIQHLLEAMIRVSDNSSAVALLHEFGSGNIDRTLRSLGLETMTLNTVELWTTADDLARLMEAIYVGEGVGAEEREHMNGLLLQQSIRTGIPAALRQEVRDGLRIGNKTGTWEGAQHDVAFVEAQTGAYVIAVLTDGSYDGWLALHRVVRDIHDTFAETP